MLFLPFDGMTGVSLVLQIVYMVDENKERERSRNVFISFPILPYACIFTN